VALNSANVHGTAKRGTAPLQNKKKWSLYSLSVDNSEVYLPPLYIKLRLIKIFVHAVDEESEGFVYLR
jgi:hypothetical protein